MTNQEWETTLILQEEREFHMGCHLGRSLSKSVENVDEVDVLQHILHPFWSYATGVRVGYGLGVK